MSLNITQVSISYLKHDIVTGPLAKKKKSLKPTGQILMKLSKLSAIECSSLESISFMKITTAKQKDIQLKVGVVVFEAYRQHKIWVLMNYRYSMKVAFFRNSTCFFLSVLCSPFISLYSLRFVFIVVNLFFCCFHWSLSALWLCFIWFFCFKHKIN